jgi:hypothetical protein
MVTIYFVLLLLAALCFGAAALSVAVQRVNLLALGLLLWVLVPLIQTAHRL